MTLEEIVAAAEHLQPAQFIQLRKQLDPLEERLWKSELAATGQELRDAGVGDQQIDQMVVRRRESRS